jgi:hypothetical protein
MSEGFGHLCFLLNREMKFSGVVSLAVTVLSLLLVNCKKENDFGQEVNQVLKELNGNQAKVIVDIDGRKFYPDSSVFTGQLLLTDQMLSLALTDQFEGKTMLSIGGEKWFEQKPISRQILKNDAFNASLKLGKLVDAKNMIGEGYMMTEGRIEAVVFERDKIVFAISGKAGKYSDFQKPEKYLPLKGLIVYKQPAINWSNVSEVEVFSSIK